MYKLFMMAGGVFGFLAVAFGAFGSHALKGKLSDYLLGVYETAVQYQMFHALALLVVGFMLRSQPESGLLQTSGWLFIAGTLLFSGSLYILSLSGIKVLGAITPIGGVAFLVAWVLVVIAIARW